MVKVKKPKSQVVQGGTRVLMVCDGFNPKVCPPVDLAKFVAVKFKGPFKLPSKDGSRVIQIDLKEHLKAYDYNDRFKHISQWKNEVNGIKCTYEFSCEVIVDDLFEDFGETPNTDEEIIDSSDEDEENKSLELKKDDEDDAKMSDANDEVHKVVFNRGDQDDAGMTDADDEEDANSGDDVIQRLRKKLNKLRSSSLTSSDSNESKCAETEEMRKNLELKTGDAERKGNNSKADANDEVDTDANKAKDDAEMDMESDNDGIKRLRKSLKRMKSSSSSSTNSDESRSEVSNLVSHTGSSSGTKETEVRRAQAIKKSNKYKRSKPPSGGSKSTDEDSLEDKSVDEDGDKSGMKEADEKSNGENKGSVGSKTSYEDSLVDKKDEEKTEELNHISSGIYEVVEKDIVLKPSVATIPAITTIAGDKTATNKSDDQTVVTLAVTSSAVNTPPNTTLAGATSAVTTPADTFNLASISESPAAVNKGEN